MIFADFSIQEDNLSSILAFQFLDLWSSALIFHFSIAIPSCGQNLQHCFPPSSTSVHSKKYILYLDTLYVHLCMHVYF